MIFRILSFLQRLLRDENEPNDHLCIDGTIRPGPMWDCLCSEEWDNAS